mgnify:CR=1 FL=1
MFSIVSFDIDKDVQEMERQKRQQLDAEKERVKQAHMQQAKRLWQLGGAAGQRPSDDEQRENTDGSQGSEYAILLIVLASGPNNGQGQSETSNEYDGWPPASRLWFGAVFLCFYHMGKLYFCLDK